MSYASTSNLAADQEYLDRLAFCVIGEARGKPSDPFVDQLLINGPHFAAQVFGPVVATAPGFGDKYEQGGQAAILDLELLSAVQGTWAQMSALYTPKTGGTPVS